MSEIARTRKPHEPLQFTIARNVSFLYLRQWKQNEPQGKTVYNVTRGTEPGPETLELVANKAEIPPWYLLLPLSEEFLIGEKRAQLSELVNAYLLLDEKSRDTVLHTVELALKAMQ